MVELHKMLFMRSQDEGETISQYAVAIPELRIYLEITDRLGCATQLTLIRPTMISLFLESQQAL